MPSPRNASAFSSFTTICSGVCFENFLMAIHSARPQAARTTQNNPLTTNGTKNPAPSRSLLKLSSKPRPLLGQVAVSMHGRSSNELVLRWLLIARTRCRNMRLGAKYAASGRQANIRSAGPVIDATARSVENSAARHIRFRPIAMSTVEPWETSTGRYHRPENCSCERNMLPCDTRLRICDNMY